MIYFLKQVTDKIKKKQYSIYASLDQVSKHPSLLRSLILKLSLHFVSGLSTTHKNAKTQTKIQ